MLSLGARSVAPTHYDAWDDPGPIAAQLRRFLDRAGAWVSEAAATKEDVDAMTSRFTTAWRAAIAEEAPHFGAAEWALLALDIELNAQGLAVAAEAKRKAA